MTLLAIILFGHYGLFFGHNFLYDDDSVNIFAQLSGNTKSMGWRPDIGLGISNFYADPGTGHIWSLWRWWFQLFSDQILAHSTAIILLTWATSFTHYLLLKKIFPTLSSAILIILASLIGFGSLRYEFFFTFVFTTAITATPLVALIIFDHLEKPSSRHFFLYTTTLFFTLYLGSAMALIYILIFSELFFLGYVLYHWVNFNKNELWKKFIRFITLQFFSTMTTIFLGAWIFYSIVIENQEVDRIRDPSYSGGTFFNIPNFSLFLLRNLGWIHSGFMSQWSANLGIQQFLGSQSWNNVVPIFPLVLILFLSFKSKNFWEFFSKFIILGLFIYFQIMDWIPGIPHFLASTFNIYPPVKLHPILQPFQIVLIGAFLNHVTNSQGNEWESKKQKWLTLLALLLTILYTFLLVIVSTSHLTPQLLIKILDNVANWFSQFLPFPHAGELIKNIGRENIFLFEQQLGFSHFLFYGITLALIILFLSERWRKVVKWRNGLPFAVLLLTNNLFLAWSVYPMNNQKLVWNQSELYDSGILKTFKPTDRVAFIDSKHCRNSKDYITCIQNKFINTPFGTQRYFFGYFNGPSLNFSAGKRFTQKSQFLHLTSILRNENIHNLDGGIRDLFPGQKSSPLTSLPSFYDSKLFDLTSVNYFLSEHALPKSENLKPVYASKQFFLYQNKNAWPYYYLANKIKTFVNLDDLYDAQQGVAYLREKNVLIDPLPNERRLVLLNFKYGDLKFQYSSKGSEFLVVQDTWHPSWRATVNGIKTKVYSTNGTFKGISLPPGEGIVHLYFDNSRYLPGIFISLLAWVLFVFAWIWTKKQNKSRLLSKSTPN